MPPSAKDVACGQCLIHPPPWSVLIAPCLYDWPISELITRFKYKNDLQAGQALAILLGQHLIERYSEHRFPDLLIPVPLHWRRRWRRGFNQSHWLALQVIRYWRHSRLSKNEQDIPEMAHKVCRRVRFTPNQQGLTKLQRQRNLTGAFEIRGDISHKSIALLDDVATTGKSAGY